MAGAGLLCAVAIPAISQTKINCQLNAARTQYEAPLAWQNTLGASRANAMCSSAIIAVVAAPVDPVVVPAVPAALHMPNMAAVQQPETAQPQMPEHSKFIIRDGEKTSTVLTNWAAAQGYSLVWDAPSQSDLPMLAGSVDATDLPTAVSKLVAGLNTKLMMMRRLNASESQFAFPVEATAYGNKVIAITVKQ